MKYYFIAGEASGDMHAANLIKALRKTDDQAQFRCFGGDKMKDAGAELFIHYRDMALMGGIEVLKKYPTIRKNLLYFTQALGLGKMAGENRKGAHPENVCHPPL